MVSSYAVCDPALAPASPSLPQPHVQLDSVHPLSVDLTTYRPIRLGQQVCSPKDTRRIKTQDGWRAIVEELVLARPGLSLRLTEHARRRGDREAVLALVCIRTVRRLRHHNNLVQCNRLARPVVRRPLLVALVIAELFIVQDEKPSLATVGRLQEPIT
eukprot:COSAG06_NODE_5234_length_3621_cov_4.128904_2_plen_158_part_00